MTIIKNLTFPNTRLTAYAEDPAVGDTEVVESMSGVTFRNARRATPRRKFSVTVWAERTNADVVAILALKATVQGRLYGFKFTPPWETTPVDVCFTEDGWKANLRDPGPDNDSHMFEISCELEEVIDGVPE
jgi:hypothetical protein